MKITDKVVDAVILRELGERLTRLRLERNLTQAELAAQAGVSKRTLERMEAGGATQFANLVRVCRALGLIERFEPLVPEPVPSPVAQLKLRGTEAQARLATPAAGKSPPAKWRWGTRHDDARGGETVGPNHRRGLAGRRSRCRGVPV